MIYIEQIYEAHQTHRTHGAHQTLQKICGLYGRKHLSLYIQKIQAFGKIRLFSGKQAEISGRSFVTEKGRKIPKIRPQKQKHTHTKNI